MSDVVSEKLQCPFVYASGKQCTGHVYRAKGYGPNRGGKTEVRKVRLWCSEKDDHQGAVNSWVTKERMEFYPNHLPRGIYDRVMALFEAGDIDTYL